MQAKEFSLKLQAKAAIWYASVYHDIPAGEFLQEYSPRCKAADAFQAFQNVTRKPGTTLVTGHEALQGLAELELRLDIARQRLRYL